MSFDWFTFGAQLINFFILLLLLKRFLFTPIQRAMRQREEAIAARFQAAHEEAQAAAAVGERWREQHQAFEAKRAELLAEAEAAAVALRKQMVQTARTEVAALQERWYAALDHEQTEFLQALRQRLNEQLFVLTRRALIDLANAELEHQIFVIFLQRLQQLPADERIRLRATVQQPQSTVIIRTTWDLADDDRQALLMLLHELLDTQPDVQFRNTPELLCGVELQLSCHRIAWSLHHYLTELEDHLADHLRADVPASHSMALLGQSELALEGEAWA
ncbi:MAG: hypothetical protein R3C14_39600 [Caldilineaceae bacterium]